MKVGENPLYRMMERHLELATEVVLEPTLYIKISKGYIPEDRIEKNYYLSTKKRNLLLSNK